MVFIKISTLVVIFAAVVCSIEAMPSDPYNQEPKRPYSFAYGIKDDYSRVNLEQTEESDGHVVRGSYQVDLPDGRTQKVNYVADNVDGYQAQVSYSGEAQYPPPSSYQPSYN